MVQTPSRIHPWLWPLGKLLFCLGCGGFLFSCEGRPPKNIPPAPIPLPGAEEKPAPDPPYDWKQDSPGLWRISLNHRWRDAVLESAAAGPPPWSLLVYYHAGDGTGAGELTWKSQDQPGTRDFDFYPQGFTDRPLVFNSEQWKTLPEEISLRVGEGFEVLSVQVEFRPPGGSRTPLRSDLGTMMYSPPSTWRNREYELFTFNLYPRILYLVSEGFSVQSRFLKRLAFFTEKPGFAGTLARDEDIAGLRDWFAHDYRARDLARFFDLAGKQNFPLNDSEILLRDILLTQGIIRIDRDAIVPGEGALIGLSVESRSRLPVYYVHETVHGLEFTMPALHTLFINYFNSLSSFEKDFLRTALIYREYNVDRDQNLLAAETMAYLLQQRPEETDRYFMEYIKPWYTGYHKLRLAALGKSGEDYTDPVLDFLAENPGIFGMRSRVLQKQFHELTGLRAETFFELLPKERRL